MSNSEVRIRPHSGSACVASVEKAMGKTAALLDRVMGMVYSCEHGLAVQDGCRSLRCCRCSNPSRLGSPYARTTILYASSRPSLPGSGHTAQNRSSTGFRWNDPIAAEHASASMVHAGTDLARGGCAIAAHLSHAERPSERSAINSEIGVQAS